MHGFIRQLISLAFYFSKSKKRQLPPLACHWLRPWLHASLSRSRGWDILIQFRSTHMTPLTFALVTESA